MTGPASRPQDERGAGACRPRPHAGLRHGACPRPVAALRRGKERKGGVPAASVNQNMLLMSDRRVWEMIRGLRGGRGGKTGRDTWHGHRWCLRVALALVVGLGGAAATGVPVAVAAEPPPPPKAGAVPIELEHLALASGPTLRAGGDNAPELDLAGRRVRFVAQVEDLEQAGVGTARLTLAAGGARVVLGLPGPLAAPERLDRAREWEVIVRIDRALAGDGSTPAFVVGPDLLVKTPGPPGEIGDDDVIVEIAGADFFADPALKPWESVEPLHRLSILAPGLVNNKFIEPGPSALARSRDAKGREVLDHRSVARATDGSRRAIRCVYRVEDGRLRNVAWGSVDLAPDGSRSKEVWVDFEKDTFHDTWSARRKSFPANTYAAACLGTAISGFPFGNSAVVRFWVWGGSGMPVPLYVWADGRSTILTPAGDQPVRRLRVGLDVRRVARQIDLPEQWRRGAEAAAESWYAGDADYWLAETAPRHVLRFEGPLGPPGSPRVRIERLRRG